MIDRLAQLRQAAPQIFRFLLSYGSAKGCVFAIPFALAAVLTPAAYGAVEFSLTAGLLIATIASFGAPQAMPRLLLIQGHSRSVDILAVTVLGAGLFALPAAIGLMAVGAKMQWWLTALCIALFSAQLAVSVWARTTGYPALSAWFDNAGTLLVGVGVAPLAIGWAIGLPIQADWLRYGMVLTVAGVLLTAAVILQRFLQPGLLAAWRRAAGMGGSMIVGGLLIFTVTGAPRLLVGQFGGMEALAIYAFAARLNLILMLGHQILMTAFFTRIYQLEIADADRLFSTVLAVLILAGILLGLAWPHLRAWMPVAVPTPIFVLVSVQTILWAASAMLEMLVNREGVAGAAAWWTGLVAGGGIGGLYLLSHWMTPDLFQLCLIFVAMLAALVMGQMAILWHYDIKVRRLLMAMPAVALVALPGLAA